LPTDRAWHEGLPDWGPLQNIPGVQMPAAAAPSTPPAPPAKPPEAPSPPKPPEASGPAKRTVKPIKEELDDEKLDELVKREQDLEADTCLFNGWVFFIKNPWTLLLGAWVAFPLGLLSVALIIPGGPMLAGIFNFFLKKKRLRRIGIGGMFIGFSSKFVNLSLAFIVPFLIAGLSPLIGLLILWGVLYSFDPYVLSGELSGLIDMLSTGFGALADISRGETAEDMLAYLNAASSTFSAILSSLFASLGTLGFMSKLAAMLGGVLVVMLPLMLGANYIFTLPLVSHYNIPFSDAMKLSTKLVSNDRQGFIFFIIYSLGLNMISPLLFFLGYLTMPLIVPGVIIVFAGWIWFMVAGFTVSDKLGYIMLGPPGLGILIVALKILAAVLGLDFLEAIVEVLNLLFPALAAIAAVYFISQNWKLALLPLIVSLIGAGAIVVDVVLYPVGLETEAAVRANVVYAGTILLYILGGLMLIIMPAITLTAYAVAYDQFCGRSRKMEDQPQWMLTIMLIFGVLGFLYLIKLAVSTLLAGYT